MPNLVLAQTSVVDPPIRSVTDENGVDLSTGLMSMQLLDVSIGNPAGGGIGHSLIWLDGSGARDQYTAVLIASSTGAQLTIGPQAARFSRSGSTFTSLQGDGATLVISGTNYIYTIGDRARLHLVEQPGRARTLGWA